MTPEAQRMSALAKANETRTANAATIRSIKGMNHFEALDAVIAILRDTDPSRPVEALPIYRLLGAPRAWGEVRTRKLLNAAGITSGDRSLRGITRRQREVIASQLENPAALWPYSKRYAGGARHGLDERQAA